MSRVLITGSSSGLGLTGAELLVSQGHQVVVLHARSADRAVDARRQLRQAAAVVIGDLETIAEFKTSVDPHETLLGLRKLPAHRSVSRRWRSCRTHRD